LSRWKLPSPRGIAACRGASIYLRGVFAIGAEEPKMKKTRASLTRNGKSPSQQIDAIIKNEDDWRGKTLSLLRALIMKADPAVVEEVKWKKPSNPSGVPVWSHDGIVCVGNVLKNAVRLTFPKGAQLKDPKKIFNTRLDSKTVRAIDVHESEAVDGAALKALFLEAVELNTAEADEYRPTNLF
jgi:hypothetical protein